MARRFFLSGVATWYTLITRDSAMARDGRARARGRGEECDGNLERLHFVVAHAMRTLGAVAAAVLGTTVAGQSDPLFRGVNVGGWLVLESWITPSLFANYSVADGLGEWQFCAQLGPAVAAQALTTHWDSWVSLQDLQTLAAAGITHLRVPVGYWIVDIQPGEPWVPGGWAYLERLLGWARQTGLQVVVDLHGAPGSQNGHDNSGFSGAINWNTPANINRTISVLQTIAQKVVAYESGPLAGVVTGIELLNEPWTPCVNGPIPLSTLRSFYVAAYAAVRGAGFNGSIFMSDGFCYDDAGWAGFMGPPAYQGVYLDTHLYHAFGGPTANLSPWQQIAYTCTTDGPNLKAHTWADWTVVGEWSLALMNGNPSEPLDPESRDWLRSFAEAQIQAYDGSYDGTTAPGAGPAKGSFFWNFKTENALEWDYLQGLAEGYLPSNASSASWSPFAFHC